MFLFKSKIDPALKDSVAKKQYKKYRVIIKCKSELNIKIIEKKTRAFRGEIIYILPFVNCIVSRISPEGILRLLEHPLVDYISFDPLAVLCGNPLGPSNGISNNLNINITGKNISIGLIDSGTYPHEDLITPRNRIVKFIDLINGMKYPYDDNGHGTFMAGLICGNGALSKGLNRGIAPDASIYSIKAFNSAGSGQISNILFALSTFLDQWEDINLRVICLPFETKYHQPFIESLFSILFKVAVNKGIIIVVPTGHNGDEDGSIMGIAALDNCITVAGVDTTSTTACPFKLSSKGPFGKSNKPDLAAAAVNLCSLNSDTSYLSERNGQKLYGKSLEVPYTSYSGTSCAAAFISGICALLLENNPKLTFKDIHSLLMVSCKLENLSKWVQGAGMIDINKLLP